MLILPDADREESAPVMRNWNIFRNNSFNPAQAKLNALNRSLAIIEFAMDGTILDANKNFLRVIGYDLDDIRGKHHSLFVDPVYAQTVEYEKFWQDLRDGHFASGEFLRLGKDGGKVWLEATYNPVLDERGSPNAWSSSLPISLLRGTKPAVC